jgi:hypothetical protein
VDESRTDVPEDESQQPGAEPYEPPVAEAIEGPDPDSVVPGIIDSTTL